MIDKPSQAEEEAQARALQIGQQIALLDNALSLLRCEVRQKEQRRLLLEMRLQELTALAAGQQALPLPPYEEE